MKHLLTDPPELHLGLGRVGSRTVGDNQRSDRGQDRHARGPVFRRERE